jgi:L-ribulokinase
LFSAIEGTALHSRVILDRMKEYGSPVKRIINGGGIPQKNALLNRVYANALNKPVLVPSGDVTSLGSAIFAFLACGEFATVQEAQDALCPPCTTYYPKEAEAAVYDELYALFRDVYFSFGLPAAPPAKMGHILPALREIASKAIAMEIA